MEQKIKRKYYQNFGINGYRIWEINPEGKIRKCGKWKQGCIFVVKNISNIYLMCRRNWMIVSLDSY